MRRLILGIDGGLAHLGWSVGFYEKGELQIKSMGVIVTVKTEDELVYKSDDDLRRAKELTKALNSVIKSHNSIDETIELICIEDMSFMRNASDAAKLKMSHGVVAALSEIFDIPIIGIAPKTLKLIVTGNPKAKKGQIKKALLLKNPALKLLSKTVVNKLAGITGKDLEHCFDATGAIYASEEREQLIQFKKLSMW